MTDRPVPRSAHPGTNEAHAHVSLLTRGQVTTLAGASRFPDLSEFNGPADWAALGAAFRAGTISAVAIRAGFGTVRADAQFGANQAGARREGIPAIYYWFCYPAYNTPTAEAGMFNYVVGPLEPGGAMCGDFEDDPQAKPFPRAQAGVDWARAFLTALQAPQNASWWYTYPSLLSTVGLQPLLGAWPFWEADYSATPDSAFFPAIARQFTDCGATPGVAGCCDQSRVLRAPLAQWLTPGARPGPGVSQPTGGDMVFDSKGRPHGSFIAPPGPDGTRHVFHGWGDLGASGVLANGALEDWGGDAYPLSDRIGIQPDDTVWIRAAGPTGQVFENRGGQGWTALAGAEPIVVGLPGAAPDTGKVPPHTHRVTTSGTSGNPQ